MAAQGGLAPSGRAEVGQYVGSQHGIHRAIALEDGHYIQGPRRGELAGQRRSIIGGQGRVHGGPEPVEKVELFGIAWCHWIIITRVTWLP